MKISNITILSTDLTNNTTKISFTISEATENVNIYLKINDEEYKEIFSNKTNETLEYTANIPKGVNNLLLKATDSTTEYISEPIQVLLKEAPSINNLECSYSDSTGKYILNFAFNGDVNFKYNIYLKLDDNDYIEVLSNQISGDKTIEQTSTMGQHTCILKVSDGYNDYTFSPFQFEITNHKPILSKVLVTDITNNGEAYIYYSTKDIESSTLTHKLAIGTTETVITPTQVDNFYSYKVTGLSEGISNCMISISDGIDTVSSDVFSIEVFSDTTDKKELLRRAKVRYDSAYQQLRDIIVSVISDLKYDYDIENDLIAKAQDNYKIEYSNFNRIAQQSIDTIGSNKVTVTKNELQSEINDVDNAVNSLETTMWGVFQDGVLDQSERDTLRNSLDLVAKEKSDIDKDYEALYNNEDLIDPSKTNLQTAYNNFCNVHTVLVTTINNLVNKETIIDNEDKANLQTAFDNWRNGLGNYRTASLEAIDAIAKKKADDSADVVDKKWAEIILDPETGIQMQVGNLTNKVNNVTTKVNDSVKDVQVMYYLSTSETVLEGGEWSDVAPQWEKDKYMWSKTVVTLTNGTVNESDPTCIAGAKGESTYTWIKYADDENGTNMSNDPTDKSYIGFAYNKTTTTESTNPTDYKWSLIKGIDGVDGTNGVDGITYYTWIKYSDNADGTGLYDIPNSNTKYIGIATNKPTATESTNKNDYVWSLFKGEDGISGTDGIGINNIVEEYYLSTSKETQEGGEWVETPPTWEVGKYMWTRSRIEYSNGTVEYTTPICDSSWEAANNVTTELQEIDERIAKIEINSDSITSTVSHITNKVDNMTIGTRNYVFNSAFDNGEEGWYLGNNCYIDKTKTLNNYPSCKSEQSGLTTDGWKGCSNSYLPTEYNLSIKAGETWTFSCWYYVENKTTFDSGLVLEIKGKPSGSTNDDTLANVPVSKDNIIEGKWTRLVKTFTADKDYDKCFIYAYVIRNGTAWFTCFQLEKSTVVSDWNTAPEDDSDRLTTVESSITQLSNSITSMVTEDDVHSIIQQTPSDIQIGFNGISNNVVINSSGLTVNQGYIACDTLTTPAGHQPVINLFQKTVYDNQGNYVKTINCQLDARTSDGGDYGGAIRLKYDSNSYLMVNDSGVFFFIEGEQAFSFVSDGSTYGAISINASNIGYLEMGASWIAYNNKGLAFDDHIHEIYSLTTHNHDSKYASSSHSHDYASSSHTHKSIQSTYSSSYNVNTYGGSTGGEVSLNAGGATVYLSNYTAFSLYPSSSNIDLGLSNNRWRYIYSQNALNTSDEKYKENIVYIDELLNNETMTLSLDNNTQQETLFLDFIKNDFRPALYNYISKSGEEQLADEQIGFVANDIIDTEVGKTFLYDYGTNGESDIMFSPIGYTTVIGRALQEEIMVRENKITELENRIAELENKLNQ